MNCPACGAQNETDAQFCAECGSPLEDNDIEATIAGQMWTVEPEPVDLVADEPVIPPEPDISDNVLAATPTMTDDQIASPTTRPEAEDLTVIGEDLLSPIEDEPVIPEPPETITPVVESPSEKAPADETSTGSRKMWYIVGGVALLLIIICCCCSIFIGAAIAVLSTDGGLQIMPDLSAISADWLVV